MVKEEVNGSSTMPLKEKFIDSLYKLVTADVHPLSYLLNVNTFLWGYFMFYYGVSSQVTFFNEWFLESSTIATTIWGAVIMIISVMVITLLIKGKLKWVSRLSIVTSSLWWFPIGAFAVTGALPFLVFSVVYCISHAYLALSSLLNTIERI